MALGRNGETWSEYHRTVGKAIPSKLSKRAQAVLAPLHGNCEGGVLRLEAGDSYIGVQRSTSSVSGVHRKAFAS